MTGTAYQWTTQAVYNAYPEAVARWEALGQTESNIHWQYGQECDALITKGIPAMIAYSAIAKKAGVKEQTIRKAYYTWRAFDEATREQYHLAPYSVFRHAARHENPEAVLEYYVTEAGASVDEVEAVYPIEPEHEETVKADYPRYMVGAYRRMIGLPAETRQRAQVLMDELVQILEAVA